MPSVAYHNRVTTCLFRDGRNVDIWRTLDRTNRGGFYVMRRRYMSDRIFNYCVAVIVRSHLGRGLPLAEGAAILAKDYRGDFIDDGFETDLIASSKTLLELLPTMPPRLVNDTPDFQLRHMLFFFAKYNLDGSKQRFNLLKIRMFGGVREPVKDRQRRFVIAYSAFVLLTTTGRVPLPPPGWHS